MSNIDPHDKLNISRQLVAEARELRRIARSIRKEAAESRFKIAAERERWRNLRRRLTSGGDFSDFLRD